MRTNKQKLNPWTSALMAAGVVSASSVLQAEEAINPVMTALQSTTISGFVDTSAIWAIGKTGDPSLRLPGRTYTGPDKMNGFNLNVVDLVIEKPVDDANWAAGYRAEFLFGPDADRLGANSNLGFADTSDFAIKNAYVNLRVPAGNGIDLKMGVWDTIIGYEVFASGNNPNYSRSYAFFIEPRIHTGLLASYDVNEILSVSGGIANNGIMSNQINSRGAANGEMTYLGNVVLTAPESAGFLEGAQLAGGVVYNPGSNGQQTMYNLYTGVTVPLPVTGLSAGVAYDHLMGEDTLHANAVGGYLVFQATEKLKLAGRVEWANGSSGTWGTVKRNGEEFLGVTATVDYSLFANTITRLEFRWDHDLADGPHAFGGANNPAENALMLALNVIYNF